MKANEAPEKIYLVPFGKPIIEPLPQEGSDANTIWSSRPYANSNAGNIEYTRTDAFIKKASGWLKDCATFTDMNGKKRIDKEMYKATVEDFKKAMRL